MAIYVTSSIQPIHLCDELALKMAYLSTLTFGFEWSSNNQTNATTNYVHCQMPSSFFSISLSLFSFSRVSSCLFFSFSLYLSLELRVYFWPLNIILYRGNFSNYLAMPLKRASRLDLTQNALLNWCKITIMPFIMFLRANTKRISSSQTTL